VHVLDAILPPPAPGENGGFYVLGLPYIERLSVLQHTILGHELGHPIEKEYFSQEDPQSYMSGLRQAVINEIGLPSPQGTLQTGTEATAMLERIVNIRHRALAELTCDLVAVNLFAFAGLLATDEFAVTQALDRPPGNWQTHYPPWRYRLRVMMGEFPENWFDQFLESGGFPEHIADIVREKVVVLRALIGKDDDKKVLEANAEFRIAYEAVEVTLPKIRNFVRDRLGGCGLTINDIIGHANGALLTRLNDWIPPDAFLNRDGHDTVADLRAILNVGWVRKLDGYTAIQGNVNDPELLRTYFRDTNAINRLVLKGIEYADIREMWAKIPKKDE
jgi:hypothetical protein